MSTLMDMLNDCISESMSQLSDPSGMSKTAGKECAKCEHDNCPEGCPKGCSCKPFADTGKTSSVDLSDPLSVADMCDFVADNLEKVAGDPPMNPPMDAGIAPGGPGSAMATNEVPDKPPLPDAGGMGQASGANQPPKRTDATEKANVNDAANAFPTNLDSAPGGTTKMSSVLDLFAAGHLEKTSVLELFAKEAANAEHPASISAGTEPELQSAAAANSAVSQGTEAGEQVPSEMGSDSGRELIGSNDSAINASKQQAKTRTVKADMAACLSETPMSASHDSALNKSLENTSEAGVKIAAARQQLQEFANASPENRAKLAEAVKIALDEEEEEVPPGKKLPGGEAPPPEAMAPPPPGMPMGEAPPRLPMMVPGQEPEMVPGMAGPSEEALAAAQSGVTPEELAEAMVLMASAAPPPAPEPMAPPMMPGGAPPVPAAPAA
jgi:hypothetical protein